MKNIVFIIFVVTLTLISCNKPNHSDSSQSMNKYFEESGPTGVITIGIKVKVTWHRAIEKRPRDGKRCDCQYCFGICDLNFGTSVQKNGMVVIDQNDPNHAVIYSFEPLEYESECPIDYDIVAQLYPEDSTQITFQSGTYDFISEVNTLNINGETFQYYGFTTVNISN